VFLQLTKFLLLYRQVSIPDIGAFKLVQTPATYNVTESLMNAPGIITELHTDGAVQDHQISFLATSLQCDEVTASHQLDEFSQKLKSYLLKGPFHWKGLGTLEYSENGILFHPAQYGIQILAPVPAERVIRDRSQKGIIDDSRDELSDTQEVVAEAPPRRRKTAVIIGLILILLSIAFIAFHFYKNGLKPSSSGNQKKIKIERSK
jgi:hypothetical protein